jgi:hypothetical protein
MLVVAKFQVTPIQAPKTPIRVRLIQGFMTDFLSLKEVLNKAVSVPGRHARVISRRYRFVSVYVSAAQATVDFNIFKPFRPLTE